METSGSNKALTKYLPATMLGRVRLGLWIVLAMAVLYAVIAPPVRATPDVTMAESSLPTTNSLNESVRLFLQQNPPADTGIYAVSYWEDRGDGTYFVSVVGLNITDVSAGWNMEDGNVIYWGSLILDTINPENSHYLP